MALALLPVLGPIRLGTVRRDALVGGAAIALCLFTMNLFPPGDPASPRVLLEGQRWTLLGRD